VDGGVISEMISTPAPGRAAAHGRGRGLGGSGVTGGVVARGVGVRGGCGGGDDGGVGGGVGGGDAAGADAGRPPGIGRTNSGTRRCGGGGHMAETPEEAMKETLNTMVEMVRYCTSAVTVGVKAAFPTKSESTPKPRRKGLSVDQNRTGCATAHGKGCPFRQERMTYLPTRVWLGARAVPTSTAAMDGVSPKARYHVPAVSTSPLEAPTGGGNLTNVRTLTTGFAPGAFHG